MSRLRNSDASALLIGLKGDYLYCDKQKNKPRLHHLVCETKCKKFKSCVSYKNWLAANKIEEEPAKDKPKKKRGRPKKKKRTTKTKRGGKK